jgi:hypothetical protein
MFVYGIAYGIATLSCVLPIFLVAVGTAAGTAPERAAGFAGFTLGMSSVITLVSLAATLADDAATRLKALAQFVAPLSGILMLAAAAYLADRELPLAVISFNRPTPDLTSIHLATALLVAGSAAAGIIVSRLAPSVVGRR